MKTSFILLALGAAGLCWGQAPPDCKPNALNIPEAKYLHLPGQPRDVPGERAERTGCARREFELDEGTG